MPDRKRSFRRYRHPNFSAVLVGNDQMALGVLSAFHQHQVAVPGEKSGTGEDPPHRLFPLQVEVQRYRTQCRIEKGAFVGRGAYLIHPAGAPGDSPFQRRQSRAGERSAGYRGATFMMTSSLCYNITIKVRRSTTKINHGHIRGNNKEAPIARWCFTTPAPMNILKLAQPSAPNA
jgi:hypothetical protein